MVELLTFKVEVLDFNLEFVEFNLKFIEIFNYSSKTHLNIFRNL
jgi:hypothetical protein